VHRIRPIILLGIGAQAQKTVQGYVRLVHQRNGPVPALLPVILQYAPEGSVHSRDEDGVHFLALDDPIFDEQDAWPTWFPPEERNLSPSQRVLTRAWMRAALLQQADDFQEFLLEHVPQLISLESVEALHAMGLGLEGDSQIEIYVVADLCDHVASGMLVDVARLSAHVCQQLGQQAGVTGLLYLPNSTSPAPAEEAVAYAALKELEYYAEGSAASDGAEIVDGLALGRVPFDRGCYLLDDVNEAGYALQDAKQLIRAACEYLYAMTFQDMAAAVLDKSHRRYRTATLRGKARSYESFGVAARYVPRQFLADWVQACLAKQMMASVLHSDTSIDAEVQARAFVE
jgi:hypothetical protein